MCRLDWDCEDSRFRFYDGTYWKDFSNAVAAIKKACLADKENLIKEMKNDGWKDDYMSWVEWCIENFLYVEKFNLMDN